MRKVLIISILSIIFLQSCAVPQNPVAGVPDVAPEEPSISETSETEAAVDITTEEITEITTEEAVETTAGEETPLEITTEPPPIVPEGEPIDFKVGLHWKYHTFKDEDIPHWIVSNRMGVRIFSAEEINEIFNNQQYSIIQGDIDEISRIYNETYFENNELILVVFFDNVVVSTYLEYITRQENSLIIGIKHGRSGAIPPSGNDYRGFLIEISKSDIERIEEIVIIIDERWWK